MNTQMNYYERLKAVDFEALVSPELQAQFAITPEVLADEVRKYLHLLASNPDQMLAPSLAVDEIYHQIFESDALRTQIEGLLEGSLAHNPGINGAELEVIYAKTLEEYQKNFLADGEELTPEANSVWH